MAQLQAVFFDLGDTLVDLGEGRGSYEARAIARAGRVHDVLVAAGAAPEARGPFSARLAADIEAQYNEALAEQRGTDIYAALRRFLVRSGLPAGDSLVGACGDAYCLDGADTTAPLRAGALDVLAVLAAAGLRLGAISNTIQPARHMNASLARRGLAPYFATCVYSSEVGVAKPHPVIFRCGLAAAGVAAARAVHVGDRLAADVAGAQEVGMKAVLIEVAHRAEEHHAIRPDARIRELSELPEALKEIFT